MQMGKQSILPMASRAPPPAGPLQLLHKIEVTCETNLHRTEITSANKWRSWP